MEALPALVYMNRKDLIGIEKNTKIKSEEEFYKNSSEEDSEIRSCEFIGISNTTEELIDIIVKFDE